MSVVLVQGVKNVRSAMTEAILQSRVFCWLDIQQQKDTALFNIWLLMKESNQEAYENYIRKEKKP